MLKERGECAASLSSPSEMQSVFKHEQKGNKGRGWKKLMQVIPHAKILTDKAWPFAYEGKKEWVH